MNKPGKRKYLRDAMNAEKTLWNDASGPMSPLGFPAHAEASHSELLILPDGRILVHNLTPAFADLLHELNPEEPQITGRTRQVAHPASRTKSHELPD